MTGYSGTTLDRVTPATRWDFASTAGASAPITGVVVAIPEQPPWLDVRNLWFDTPRTVARGATTSASSMYRLPVVWEAQFVDAAEADYYEVAPHLAAIWAAQILATKLEDVASGRSSMRRIRRLPLYRSLLELDQPAVSVALERLRGTSRPLWLAFLRDAVVDRPAEGSESIDEAAAAWRDWGRHHRLVA